MAQADGPQVQEKQRNIAQRMYPYLEEALQAIPGLSLVGWKKPGRLEKTGSKKELRTIAGSKEVVDKALTLVDPGEAEPVTAVKGHVVNPVSFLVLDSQFTDKDEGRQVSVLAKSENISWEVTCTGIFHKAEADVCASHVLDAWALEQKVAWLRKFAPPFVLEHILAAFATSKAAGRPLTLGFWRNYWDCIYIEPEGQENDAAVCENRDGTDGKKQSKKATFIKAVEELWCQVIVRKEGLSGLVREDHPMHPAEAVSFFEKLALSPHAEEAFNLMGTAPICLEPEALFLHDGETGKVFDLEGEGLAVEDMLAPRELASSIRDLDLSDGGSVLDSSFRSQTLLTQPAANTTTHVAVPQRQVEVPIGEIRVHASRDPSLARCAGALATGMAGVSKVSRTRVTSPPSAYPFSRGMRPVAFASTSAPNVITLVYPARPRALP